MTDDSLSPLPWHEPLLDAWRARRERLPQALLLYGPHGAGKGQLAAALAAVLLCERPDAAGSACGACAACGWLARGTHPDCLVVEPEAPTESKGEGKGEAGRARDITVGQIRELNRALALSPHGGRARAVLIRPAEALNPAAANALLKTLEEPPPGTHFLLTSHSPGRLLPTVLSRCQKTRVPLPDTAAANAWLAARGVESPGELLAEAGGAPLLAMAYAHARERRELSLAALARDALNDPLQAAGRLATADLAELVGRTGRFTHDLLRVRLGGRPYYFPGLAATLTELAGQVRLPALLKFQRELTAFSRDARHPLGALLFVESLLLQYAALFEGNPDGPRS